MEAPSKCLVIRSRQPSVSMSGWKNTSSNCPTRLVVRKRIPSKYSSVRRKTEDQQTARNNSFGVCMGYVLDTIAFLVRS